MNALPRNAWTLGDGRRCGAGEAEAESFSESLLRLSLRCLLLS